MKGSETWHNTCCLAEYKDACHRCIKLSVCVCSWLTDDLSIWGEERRGVVHIFHLLMPRFLHISSISFTMVSSFHSFSVYLVFPSFLPWMSCKVCLDHTYLPYYPSPITHPIFYTYFTNIYLTHKWEPKQTLGACTSHSLPLLDSVPSCHKRWILNKFPLRTLTPETHTIVGAQESHQ